MVNAPGTALLRPATWPGASFVSEKSLEGSI